MLLLINAKEIGFYDGGIVIMIKFDSSMMHSRTFLVDHFSFHTKLTTKEFCKRQRTRYNIKILIVGSSQRISLH